MSALTLHTGDCREVMAEMDADSVDAIVTDPPYGLRFMGSRWDYDVPSVETFEAALRVLKDGGRMLCFAGARTAHRMTVNIEDAGFTIEDVVMWLYGSGFPKHDSKLKPAYEPIVVARKGRTSELNIDECRIAASGPSPSIERRKARVDLNASQFRAPYKISEELYRRDRPGENIGRWPANVVLDEEAAARLDAEAGDRKAGGNLNGSEPSRPFATCYGDMDGRREWQSYADAGGASRFFYTSKASRAEREQGLGGATERPGGSTAKGFTDDVAKGQDRNRPAANHHPTVKPLDLMQWLVRLVAKPGDVVLDPFMGSGTTGMACVAEGRQFVGIEKDAEYAEIARRRIVSVQPSLFVEARANGMGR